MSRSLSRDRVRVKAAGVCAGPWDGQEEPPCGRDRSRSRQSRRPGHPARLWPPSPRLAGHGNAQQTCRFGGAGCSVAARAHCAAAMRTWTDSAGPAVPGPSPRSISQMAFHQQVSQCVTALEGALRTQPQG
jgi:hypothetical protein